MCLKGLIAAVFDSSEPLLLLRLNGGVGAIPTYRVYRLYDIYMTAYHIYTYSNYRHILFMFITTLGLGGWDH